MLSVQEVPLTSLSCMMKGDQAILGKPELKCFECTPTELAEGDGYLSDMYVYILRVDVSILLTVESRVKCL